MQGDCREIDWLLMLSHIVILCQIFCFRYFVTSIFCFRYFDTSIFCLSIFSFLVILSLRYFVTSTYCLQYFAFDILSDDILRIRYFAIRYYAYSIFCDFDILRLQTFFSFEILRAIFCNSIFCVSILRHGGVQAGRGLK